MNLASLFWDLSKRCLIRVNTVCLQEFLFKNEIIMKNTPDTTKIGNGLIQLIWMDGSTRQMWVKLSFASTYSNFSSMLRTAFSISDIFFCNCLLSVCSFWKHKIVSARTTVKVRDQGQRHDQKNLYPNYGHCSSCDLRVMNLTSMEEARVDVDICMKEYTIDSYTASCWNRLGKNHILTIIDKV